MFLEFSEPLHLSVLLLAVTVCGEEFKLESIRTNTMSKRSDSTLNINQNTHMNILSFSDESPHSHDLKNKRRRFYKTVFENHDNEILGMFCLQSNQLLSVDSSGGLKRLNLDQLTTETLDLFGESKILITCVSVNEEGDALFFGLESGAIWTSDLNTSDELIYSHSGAVTAIASAKSTVFTAGQDMTVKMFNLKSQSLVANISCAKEIVILKPLTNVYGSPIVVADLTGCVSIWSPHLLKKSIDSVQFCCQMQKRIISLIQLTLFHRTCIVCVTSNQIRIYCITELDPSRDQQERISILKDETYSLVRSINPPDDSKQFTSCYSMDSFENKVNSNLNSLLFASSSNGYVYLLEPISGQVLRKYQVTSPEFGGYVPCRSLIYLPAYQILAVTDQKNSLYLINPSSSPLIDSIPFPTSSIITCVTATDLHSAIIAYGDSNGLVHLSSNVSNLTHSKQPASQKGDMPPLTSVSAIAVVLLEANGELVVISGHSNGLLQAYVCSIDGIVPTLETAKVNQIPNVYHSKITAIQNVPSSTPTTIASDRIATASELESIIIWKLNSTGIIKIIQLTDSLRIQSLLVHPEGYLVGNDANSRLNLWNINDNWKKMITHSTQTYFQTSRTNESQSNQFVESDSEYEIAKIGLMFDARKNIHYIISTSVNYDKIKYWKIRGKNHLYLDAIVELPQRFANIHFWCKGESNLIFLQSTDGSNSYIYSMNIQLAASSKLIESSRRYFVSSSVIDEGRSCQLLGVTGETSPIVVTVERDVQSSSIVVWNNDLHDQDQFYQSGILRAIEHYTSYQLNKGAKYSQRLTEDYLWSLVESHPSFPGCLLVPDIDLTGKYQNIFAAALLADYSSLLHRYLPKLASIALTQASLYLNRRKSLLYIALKLKDISAINLLLQLWSQVVSQTPNSNELGPEISQYHVMELFDDLKILSREFPAQYAQFIQNLEIPMNHSIVQKNCPTKVLTSSFSSSSLLFSSSFADCSMRGTEFRVIPSFWSNENKSQSLFHSSSAAYPDLMARMMATPEEEAHWLSYEQPHRCQSLQQVHTSGIEYYDHMNSTMNEGQHQDKPLTLSVKIEADDLDQYQSISSSASQTREGILVQAHVHPIPYAAAGVEFLRICQRTAQLTGQRTLLSCPIVATIIDYKWNTASFTSYSRYFFHYFFLFILYSFLCIYYDQLTSAPHKTGLPILVWIVSFLLIWNYFLLFLQILLRLLSDGYQMCFFDPWFYYGLVTYALAMTGIFMALFHNDNEDESQELSHRTSFNSRSLLSAVSLLLSIQFLYILLPLQSIGPFIQRLFLTIQSLYWNFLLLFFCIISFSVSFNLFHHRASYSHHGHGHEGDEPVTYSSFYGSILQSFLYVFGGYSTDTLFHQADSPILMSIYFIVFIVIMIWVLILYLLLTALEVYQSNESLAICLWRENQLRIILQNSSLLGEEISSNIFHNPKWLQILIPSHQAHLLQPLSSTSSSYGCKCSKENLKGNCESNDSIEEIRRDMDLLKDILYQLHDSLSNLSLSSPRIPHQTLCSCNCPSEEQLMRRIESLFQQYNKPPPPTESPLPPIKVEIPPPLQVRTMSKTDEEVIRPPLDTTPTNKKKGDSGIRVRQIKASKKKLSSKISGLDYEET